MKSISWVLFRHIAVLGILLTCTYLSAQNAAVTKGMIRDSMTLAPLIGANIALYDLRDSLLSGTVSDVNGKWTLEFSSAATKIEVSYVGYTTKQLIVSGKGQLSMTYIDLVDSGLVGCGPLIIAKRILPSQITTIDRAFINQLDLVASNESLDILPGITFQQGTLTTNRLSIRGIGGRSPFSTSGIKAYMGEIPLHGLDGSSTIEDIGTMWSDQISIIKGHTGPGYSNGYGGAILLSKNPVANHEMLQISTRQTIGQWGTHNQTYRASGTRRPFSGKRMTFDIAYDRLSSEGYRDNSAVKRGNLLATVTQEFGRNHRVEAHLIHTDLYGAIPSSLSLADFRNEPSSAASTWSTSQAYEDYSRTIVGVTYHGKYTKVDDVLATVYLHNLGSEELRPFNTQRIDATTVGARLKLRDRLWQKDAKAIDVEVGTDVRQDMGDITTLETLGPDSIGATIGEISYTTRALAHYAKISYQFNKWYLSTGIDATLYQLTQDLTSGSTQWALSPSAEVSYRHSNQLSGGIRMGLGHQYPVGDQVVLPSGQFNTDLQPSTAREIALSIDWEPLTNMSLTGTIYQMQVSDEITSRSDSQDNTIWSNTDNSTLQGIEIAANYSTSLNEQQSIQASFYYTYMDNRFDEVSLAASSDNVWPGVAASSAAAVVQYAYNRWTLGIRSRYTGGIYLDSTNDIKTDPYWLTTCRLSYQTRLLPSRLLAMTISTEVNNIADVSHSSMVRPDASAAFGPARSYYPGLPRHVIASISLDYRIQ